MSVKNFAIGTVAGTLCLAAAGTRADSPYGTCSHIGRGGYWSRTNTWEMVKSVDGLGWLRVDMDWKTVRRPDGRWDFSKYDQLFADAAHYGIKLLPILGGPPDGDGYADFDGWLEYVREMVRRYGKKCRVFEIINEPGHNGKFDTERYARYFAAAAAEIRKIDPGIRIMIGEFGVERTKGVYALGAGKDCDILNIHPYSHDRAPWIPEGVVDASIEEHLKIPVEAGCGQKQIWVTEVGWPTTPEPPAAQVVRAGIKMLNPSKSDWRVAYIDKVEEGSFCDTGIRDALEIAFPKGSTIRIVSQEEAPSILFERAVDVVVLPFGPEYPDKADREIKWFVTRGGVLVDLFGRIRNAGDYHLSYTDSASSPAAPEALETAPAEGAEGIVTRGSRFRARMFLTKDRLAAGDEFRPILSANTNGSEFVAAALVRLDGGKGGSVITSTVYDHWYRTSSESRQAKMLVRSAALAFAAGAEKYFWYKGRSWERDPADGEQYFGFAHKDWSPKPAMHAYRTFISMRPPGSENVKCEWKDPASGLYFPQWTCPDGTRAGVVWTIRKTAPVDLQFDSEKVAFFDMRGNTLQVTRTGRSFRVPVSDGPIYFRGASLVRGGAGKNAVKYEATWESIDSRPVPQWWCDAKFGIFIHWGPYSVPAFAPTDEKEFSLCYAEWYKGRLDRDMKSFKEHHAKYYGNMPYANFAAQFTARFFKPEEWARLFRKSGAKYVVLTAKHHDGYALWPSEESPYYNSVELGSGRDLCRELGDAVRAEGLKMGYYYSLIEYANPQFTNWKHFSAQRWADEVNLPQMRELVEDYKADILWLDGSSWRTTEQWKSLEFLKWLYNESSMRETIVVNDRWGKDTRGKHGGHYCTEYGKLTDSDAADGLPHPWEECRGIGRSFGLNRFERTSDYMSEEELVRLLAKTASGGGNLLLDIGPDADGLIPVIQEERLLQIGAWLERHGDAIYGTTAGPVRIGDKVVSTRKGSTVNLLVLDATLEEVDFELDGRKRHFLVPLSQESVRVVSFER